MENPSLYERLGGYDNIASVANDLLPRLMADPVLGRFWKNRGEDGLRREKQLLIDFLFHIFECIVLESIFLEFVFHKRDFLLCLSLLFYVLF